MGWCENQAPPQPLRHLTFGDFPKKTGKGLEEASALRDSGKEAQKDQRLPPPLAQDLPKNQRR
eukprot:5969783-Amphidinium_carterae.2